MKTIFGPTISLATKHGNFSVTHISVTEKTKVIKEGVLLTSLKNDFEAPVFVRIQSSCLFSESFWATDCDCALQLQKSLEIVHQLGGYVLYFYEEGRGAGLNTKFKAIELQQINAYDTKTAYECLKINPDIRTYEISAMILKEKLDNKSIILLTNNQNKVDGLLANGINVTRREPLVCGLESDSIKAYLIEKQKALGHHLF